jgi:undecaprenyl-diphosphatase
MRVLHSLQDVDQRMLLFLQESEGWFALHSRGISRTADGHLYVLIGTLLVLLVDDSGPLLQHLLLAFAAERGIYWVMKNTLRRRRPANALPGFRSQITASDEFSFPSGHTSAAFLFVTLLALHFGPVALLLYPWAAAVGLSRVFLGVHFPFDTVMGALLGSSIAVFSFAWLY